MYNSVLADLNEDAKPADETDPSAPAAEKALPSGGRRSAMVYNRFRKSKDLRLYDKDDLGSILGASDKRPKRILAQQESEVRSISRSVHAFRLHHLCR
eukprot:m.332853 g.332853  ORF g.332853 m.332853 type:complete len:98 (+) comp55642_c0_seq4:362-655(+)